MKIEHLNKRFVAVVGVIALLMMVSFSVAQNVNVSESELQFRDAQHKQTVEGDLTSAIKIYLNIVASKTADKAVKAKALLQLAACYEKQGQKSEAVYQQIVRDYPDQPAYKDAKAKLADLHRPAQPSTQTLRKIELGTGVQNVVATDGQRAIYWDTAETTLFFGDVAGKTRNRIFTTTPDRRPVTSASRDLSTLAFYFPQSAQKPPAYGVVKTDGSGYREVELTINGVKAPLVISPRCLSWSRDNRYVLMCRGGADRLVHLTKVSVADGQIVDLSPDLKVGIIDAVFSPDDRYIAFVDAKGSVFIVRAKGGEPRLMAENAGLVDWTEDGKYFVFFSRQGKIMSLYAAPIKDGQPAGDRIFIRQMEKMFRPVRYGSSLVYGVAPDSPLSNVSVVSIEGERLGQWKTLDLVGAGQFYPTWSPDASRIAYVSHRAVGDRESAVRIYNVLTGEDRELFRSTELLVDCLWASQHPNIYCGQMSTLSKTELLSVSLETGRAEKIMTFDGQRLLRRLSPDDRILSMANLGPGGGSWPRWEIGADKPEAPGPNLVSTSPDGRWVLRTTTDAQGRREYQMRPISGGDADWRHITYLRRQAPPGIGPFPSNYSPDSNWFFFHDKDPDGKDSLYRVSTSGGAPYRLGSYPTSQPASVLNISADGHHILVDAPPTATPQPSEYWLLQNFIPATAKAVAK